MKHTLETIKEKLLNGDKYTCGEVLMEIEGFEKELKAKREKDAKKCGHDIADYVRISEVLGEDKR